MVLVGLEQVLMELEQAGPELQCFEQLEPLLQRGQVGLPYLVAFGQLSLATMRCNGYHRTSHDVRNVIYLWSPKGLQPPLLLAEGDHHCGKPPMFCVILKFILPQEAPCSLPFSDGLVWGFLIQD